MIERVHMPGDERRTLALPGARVDLVTLRVRRSDGSEARLTAQEARLLARLADTPGEAVSREVLLEEVWGYHPNVVSRAPDVAIRRLRTKIEADPSEPRLVVTVAGEGWALAATSSAPAAERPADPGFVGRDDEIARVDAAWRDGHRLVVLVGPPGTGKSALARRVVAGVPGPVWEASLQGARDLADVVAAVAGAAGADLGEAADATAAAARLSRVLDDSGALLVLDPFERLVDVAAEVVAGWAAGAARVLVCSRERLRVPGEHVVRVGPLPPDDAVRLFRRRATDAGWREDVGEEAIRSLVGDLDGLPLAIELAASRARTLGVRGLLGRGGVRLDRLERGPEGTLRRAIAGSWDLLDPFERRVLAAVTVFADGFDVAAAEAASGLAAEPGAPFCGDVLESLEDQSLLAVRQTPTGPRFFLLDAVRWFAAATLGDEAAFVVGRCFDWALALPHDAVGAEAGNLRALIEEGRRHAPERVAALALRVDDVLGPRWPLSERVSLVEAALATPRSGPLDLAVRLRRADLAWREGARDAEDRLRAVADEAGSAGQHAIAGQATVSLALARRTNRRAGESDVPVLEDLVARATDRGVRVAALRELADQHVERGAWREARLALEQAMALDEAGGGRLRVALLNQAAKLAIDARRPRDGLPLLDEALALLRERPDGTEAEVTWRNLGAVRFQLGDLDAATTAWENALALEEELGLWRPMAVTLGNLGSLYSELGELAEARRSIERAMAFHRELGQARSETATLINLGIVALLEGDHAEARDLLERGVRRAEERGWRPYLAAGLVALGQACVSAGDRAAGRAVLDRAAEASAGVGAGVLRGVALGWRGAAEALDGELDAAIASFAAAEASLDGPSREADAVGLLGTLITGAPVPPVSDDVVPPTDVRLARALLRGAR